MKTILLPFYLFFILSVGFSQTLTIKGKITDKSNSETLPGCVISVPDQGKGTFSDEDGKFLFSVESKAELLIRFTYVGYVPIDYLLKTESGKMDYDLKIEMVEEGVIGEEVVITAGKYEQKLADVPISMEVIKPKQIELQTTSEIEDVLQQSPGVDILDGQLNIRGSSGFAYGVGSRVMIMLDGLPLLTADASFAQFDMIPTDNIAQIEIMKGAASVLYGSSAMGGVVNVITGDAAAKPKTSIRLRTTLYDKPANSSLDWDGSSAANMVTLNAFHSRKIKNNDITGLVDFIKNTGYVMGTNQKKFRTLWTAKFRPEKIPGLTFGFNTGYVSDSSGAYLYWGNYLPGYDSLLQKSTLGALQPDSSTLRKQLNTRFTFDPWVKYLSKNGNIFGFKSRLLKTNNQNNSGQSATNHMWFNDIQYVSRFLNKRIAWVTGFTGIYSSVIGDSLYGGKHYMINLAGYTQLDTKFFEGKLNATLGGRVESIQYDDGYSKFAPILRAGLNYNTFPGNNIRASYGMAFRAPSVAERYTSTTGGALVVSPNPDLLVENGYSSEIGIRQGFKLGSTKTKNAFGFLDACAFIMDFDNMIEFGAKKPESFTFSPVFWAYNVTHAQIKGGEITGMVSGNYYDIGLDISGGVTLLEPKNLNPASDSEQVYLGDDQTPGQKLGELLGFINGTKFDNPAFLKYRNKLTIRGQATLSYKKLGLSCNYQYKSAMRNYDQFLNIAIPGADYYVRTYGLGYQVFDFVFSYQISENAKFTFNLENVFNEQYVILPGMMAEQRKFTTQFQYVF